MDYRQLASRLLSDYQDMKAAKADAAPLFNLEEVSGGEAGALLLLFRRTKPMLAGDIARQLGLTTGRMAIILNRLEAKDLVRRCPVPEDRRLVQVSMTPAGVRWAQTEYEQAIVKISCLLERLGEADAQDFLRLIEKMKQTAQRR